MKKSWLLIFAIILILFAVFSTTIVFHDTGEYVTNAKALSGVKNLNIFVTHSIFYSSIISLFLRVWPSLITIKLINVFWLFLIGLTLLKYGNKKAFIIFAFSPLIWITSIQTTPILPASFFFLLSFIFLKREDIKYNYIISGIFQGLSFAVYTPMIIINFLFILIYFWDKKSKDTLIYIIAFLIGLLPSILLEIYLFNFPFYTLLRYVGNSTVIFLGLHPENPLVQKYSTQLVLLIIFAISPLLFKIYKIDYKKYKREIIFLILVSIIIILRAALIKYFLLIFPILIFLLVKVYTKNDIKWHIIISVFIIVFLTYSYFIPNQENIIENDIKNIINDYDVDYIVAGPLEAPKFATYSWDNSPHFVWFQDFNTGLEDKTTIRYYDYDFNSNIPLKDILQITAKFNRFNNQTYDNFIIVTQQSEEEFPQLTDYTQDKCYETLCVYK